MNVTPSRLQFLQRPQALVLSVPLPFPDAVELYCLLERSTRPSFLLESGGAGAARSRYSFLGSNPYLILRGTGQQYTLEYPATGRIEAYQADPWTAFAAMMRRLRQEPAQGTPPFCGGAVVILSYAMAQRFEPVRLEAPDDGSVPDLTCLFVDQVAAVDHVTQQLSLMFCPPRDRLEGESAEKLYREGRDRLQEWHARFLAPRTSPESMDLPTLHIEPHQDRLAYTERVRACQAFIKRGDIYQANLSHRFGIHWPALQPTSDRHAGLELYRRLRSVNPSPFSAYVDLGSWRVLSSSPERLVRLVGRHADTRPIAGTRPRGVTTSEDHQFRADLLSSDKERAEHLMLVDLERNDLGRVCRYGSVRVDEFMAIESYSHVNHLVSNISGELQSGMDGFDLIPAMFPGGTITGVPKIRCMQIIDELEPVARGAYTGSLGYVSWNGDLDLNIIIRSLVMHGSRGHLQVGAGIVADSVPDREYDETLFKAQAAIQALQS